MNKETLKNIIRLFTFSQSYIPNARVLNYSDLSPIFGNSVTADEYSALVENAISSQDMYFLSDNNKYRFALLVKIELFAKKICLHINPKQRLILITLLLELPKNKNQDTSIFLDDVLYAVSDMFAYSLSEIDSIRKIYYSNLPSESDYGDSLLLTNKKPDYLDVIEGLRVVYNPDFQFVIWVKNVKSVNYMVFKIVELDNENLSSVISEGDIVVYNKDVQSLLDISDISFDFLASKIVSDALDLPRVEIDATDKSPLIILNSDQNRIEIDGFSIIRRTDNFFEPIFYWLDKIRLKSPESFEIHVNLSFFNPYTSKMILKLFQQIIEFERFKCETSFYWYSESDDPVMKEVGEHYSAILQKEFTYISSYEYA